MLHSEFWQQEGRLLLQHAPEAAGKIAVTLALYAVTRWLLGRAIDAVLASIIARSTQAQTGYPPGRAAFRVGGIDGAARLRTLQALLRSTVNYLLIFIAGMMIFDTLGINISAVLAGAGVAGMAIGFGAQRLVRDVITGFFILMEDQYSVGDLVTIGAVTGEVVDIGMRITRLRDATGRLVILANGDISS